MSVKNAFINILTLLIAISIFCLAAEFIIRLFWDSGYRHRYDWSDRTEGYSFEKESDTFRILVLGDSVAYGQGVRRDETFAKLLENDLNIDRKMHYNHISRFEVINIGWPGINTADEYFEFVDKGIQYNPDLVLVAYSLNDIGTPNKTRLSVHANGPWQGPYNFRGALNRKQWAWSLPIPESLNKYLTSKSDFYIFLLHNYNNLLHEVGIRKNDSSPNDELIKLYSANSQGWSATRAALNQIIFLCKQKQIRSALVIIPEFYTLEYYPFGEIHRKVAHVATDLGFKVLDILPVFIGKNSKEFIVSRIDSHPNALAHSIIAPKILQFIVKEGLFR